MKPAIIIVCLLLFCCINSINAQWYNSKYGVENLDDLSNDQLMEGYSDAKTTSLVGGLVTGTGIILMISGAVTGMLNATEDVLTPILTFGIASSSHDSYGGGLLISGAVLTIGGAIIWGIGGSRKKQLRPIINSRSLVSNISVYPGTAYEFLTDTYYPAVTLRIGFK